MPQTPAALAPSPRAAVPVRQSPTRQARTPQTPPRTGAVSASRLPGRANTRPPGPGPADTSRAGTVFVTRLPGGVPGERWKWVGSVPPLPGRELVNALPRRSACAVFGQSPTARRRSGCGGGGTERWSRHDDVGCGSIVGDGVPATRAGRAGCTCGACG